MQVIDRNQDGADASKEVPVVDDDVREIALAWLTVMRRANLPRVQEQLAQQAGVHLDRTGYFVLRLLGESQPMRVSELAHRQGTDVSTACRQVAKCEHAGLVRREGDPSDMRAVLFMLTDQGRDALERLQRARLEMFAGFMAGWTPEDRHEFARLTKRFGAEFLTHAGVH